MATAILGDSILEKILCAEIAEIVNKKSSLDKVPTYSEEESSDEEEWGDNAQGWGHDEDGWGDDEEVVIEEEEEEDDDEDSRARRLSSYSLGYLDFSDHQEGRVENTLWYQLKVKHNNIITEKRPPPPPPQPTPPRRLPPLVRYARYLGISDDDEEEVEKLLCEWGWPPSAQSTTTGPTSHPALTV